MIDWVYLAANALWILGCSVILAAASYASWLASEKKEKFFTSLRSKGVWLALHTGGILFCAGLAATSNSPWQTILWLILGIGVLVHQFIG